MANLLEKSSILITPTAYSDGKIHSAKPIQSLGGLDASLDFTRGSSATRVNADGLIESSQGINTPRINYKDGVGSLLIEPQSTNLVTQSEAFDNAYWTKSGATVTSGFSAPSVDSPLGAFKLVESAVNASHYIFNQLSTTLGQTYSSKIYVKAEERSKIGLREVSAINSWATFDLTLGTVIDSFGSTPKIVLLEGGWYEISYSQVAGATTYFGIYILQDSYVSGTPDFSYQGDGTSGVYIFGAQLEAQSSATSYIPTSGTIQTRLAETASKSGISSLINSSEGVLYAEFSREDPNIVAHKFGLNDGSKVNQIVIETRGFNDLRVTFIENSNFTTLSNTSVNLELINKISVVWNLNRLELWLNGFKVAEDLSIGQILSNSLNTFAFSEGDGTDKTYQITKNLIIYKEALTDEELTCLTTL